jgi:prenyltransferase beta subunit
MNRFALSILFLFVCLVPATAQTASEKKAAIAYLENLQQKDGGFLAEHPKAGAARSDGSSLRATLSAIRVLKYCGGQPKDGMACARYVENAFDKTTGGFRDTQPDGKVDVGTTAVGLMAVVELRLPLEKYGEPAVKYLAENAKTFEEIRIAAAGFESVGKRPVPVDAWLDEVAKLRNADGTYGKGDGTARDTGSAVALVLRLGGKVEQRDNVLKALKAGQRKDGAFGKAGVESSDLETTYRVMRAFHMMKEKPDVAACRAFVVRCRNEDGGYGVAPQQTSTTGATYFAMSILHWLEEE